uniref:Uncharacterized protein n=1 Tax=Heterorhabditis bacteriophora TaxID=37862 RepID=A0A1I7WF53_HETBA
MPIIDLQNKMVIKILVNSMLERIFQKW